MSDHLDTDIAARLERIRKQSLENRMAMLARKRNARMRKKFQGGNWWMKQARVAEEGRKELPASDRE